MAFGEDVLGEEFGKCSGIVFVGFLGGEVDHLEAEGVHNNDLEAVAGHHVTEKA